MENKLENKVKVEKRLLKRLRRAHYNFVNRVVKEILESIIEKNSVYSYAKKWIENPELQRLWKGSETGIRLDYLRNENRRETCHYEVYCNINQDGNRVLNELLGKYKPEKDYCTCFLHYKTYYENKLENFGVYSVTELETVGKSVFLIPFSKLKTLNYDLQGLKPVIVWNGTYWNPETRLFDNKLHRKAGIQRCPWNEIRKTLLEDHGVHLSLNFYPNYLKIKLLSRYYELQKLKLIQKLFPEDVVSFHIKPFLEHSEYVPHNKPDISIFFKNKTEKHLV